MPLPLTVSCFSKIQIGFTFLVPAHPGSPGQRAVKRVCVCVTYMFKLEIYSKHKRIKNIYILYTTYLKHRILTFKPNTHFNIFGLHFTFWWSILVWIFTSPNYLVKKEKAKNGRWENWQIFTEFHRKLMTLWKGVHFAVSCSCKIVK